MNKLRVLIAGGGLAGPLLDRSRGSGGAPLVPARPKGPVTLVGDAAHCMPPAGVGAAVALRDAGLLAGRLGEAGRGERPLVEAIRAYEEEMLDYGFAAVAEAERVTAQLSPTR